MNTLHMKYAVEVANFGSLNKAAEELLIAPPNLSRSIKELEAYLGITIFDRSSRGMLLTKQGEDFIIYARKILAQLDDIEHIFKGTPPEKKHFSISVPRASYIADAFVNFSKSIGKAPTEIYYKETNPYRAIKNITEDNYKLGIIRYASGYEHYFSDMLKQKDLDSEIIAQFHYVLIFSSKSILAKKDNIRFDDLSPMIEIAHADPFVPSLPLAIVKKKELPNNILRRIFIFERGSQFYLLAENPETFMWVSPVPKKILASNNLIQKECPDNKTTYKDALIFHKHYNFSELDKKFLAEVHKSLQDAFTANT